MGIMGSSTKVSVYDSKGRPLFSVRGLENGKDQWIFHRYVDMLEGEKKVLREMHILLAGGGGNAVALIDGKETKLGNNLDDFLDFKEEKDNLCG
jgi:hypothetical protein